MTRPSAAAREAKALHARAEELAARRDYHEALDLCRRALALDDHPRIRETYDRLLATIGPY